MTLGTASYPTFHVPQLKSYIPDISLLSFGISFVMVNTAKPLPRAAAGLAVSAAVAALHVYGQAYRHFTVVVFAVLLPTLIHVYVFTNTFILFGTLKRGALAGYLTYLAHVVSFPAALWLPVRKDYVANPAVMEPYRPFAMLNMILAPLMGTGSLKGLNWGTLFTHPASIAITRFIAFAYCYHYLNWFSKTSFIGWHKSTAPRLALIIGLWVASVGVYAYNYTLGLNWLFLLSMGHVYLELPLNHISAMGISKSLYSKVTGTGGGGGGPPGGAKGPPKMKAN